MSGFNEDQKSLKNLTPEQEVKAGAEEKAQQTWEAMLSAEVNGDDPYTRRIIAFFQAKANKTDDEVKESPEEVKEKMQRGLSSLVEEREMSRVILCQLGFRDGKNDDRIEENSHYPLMVARSYINLPRFILRESGFEGADTEIAGRLEWGHRILGQAASTSRGSAIALLSAIRNARDSEAKSAAAVAAAGQQQVAVAVPPPPQPPIALSPSVEPVSSASLSAAVSEERSPAGGREQLAQGFERLAVSAALASRGGARGGEGSGSVSSASSSASKP